MAPVVRCSLTTTPVAGSFTLSPLFCQSSVTRSHSTILVCSASAVLDVSADTVHMHDFLSGPTRL